MIKYKKGKWGLDTFLQDKNNQSLVSGTANTVSGTISALDAGNQFGNKSTGSTVTSSALTGMGIGTNFGPIGTAVGAGLGGLYGLIKAGKDRKEEQSMLNDFRSKQTTLALNNTRNRSLANPELFSGGVNNGYYENGGELNNHSLGKSKGGQIHQLTDDDSIVKGKTHDEGGVKFPEQGVELENNETLNKDFVFSKELGFADKHLKIIKEKQKLEGLMKDRPNDMNLINSLNLTENKIERLKKEQEQTKQLLGLDNDNDEYARGGSLFNSKDLLDVNIDYDSLPSANVVETKLESTKSPIILEGFNKTNVKSDSIAVRNNNPRNIKFGSFAERFGAIKGDKATDGGVFAKFPTVEAGLEAGKELFKSKGYRDLDVDSALKRWSNSGYGVNIYPELRDKKVKDLNDNELSELTKRQIKSEDMNMYNRLYGTKKLALGGYLKLENGGDLEELKKLKENKEKGYSLTPQGLKRLNELSKKYEKSTSISNNSNEQLLRERNALNQQAQKSTELSGVDRLERIRQQGLKTNNAIGGNPSFNFIKGLDNKFGNTNYLFNNKNETPTVSKPLSEITKEESNKSLLTPSTVKPSTLNTTPIKTPVKTNSRNKVPIKTNVNPVQNIQLDNNNYLPTNTKAGGDRFTQQGKKPLLLTDVQPDITKDKTVVTKGLIEPSKNKGFDVGKLSDTINNYGSDVVGLLRKYPNVPSPELNSEIRLNRVNLSGDRVQAGSDFKNALAGTENLSSNVSAGIRGNLLAKKYQMNNDISQRENLANVDISNREALTNAEINQQNKGLLNQYNQNVADRNVAIQNANQSYLGNINEKMLLDKREDNQRKLDLAKLYINSSIADEGVRKRVNETTGLNGILDEGKKYLQGYLPKKNGGKLKIK